MPKRARNWMILGVVIAAVIPLAGCATYANYPSIGNDMAVNDPNVAPLPELCERSLTLVIDRYPVGGEYVINFPRGMERTRALSLAEKIGGDQARIVSPESEGLPVYHVSRIWLRGDGADVDVIRPVVEEMVARFRPQSESYWELWVDGEKAVSEITADEIFCKP